MTATNVWLPSPGLYRVYWTTGGSSLASVGVNPNGSRWIAPINWSSGSADYEAHRVSAMERLDVSEPIWEKAGDLQRLADRNDLLEGRIQCAVWKLTGEDDT